MQIQKVTLKEIETYTGEDGEFHTRYINQKTYPAFLTNFAMHKAKNEGVINSSLFNDLVKFQSLQGTGKGKTNDLSVLADIDEENMQKVIYVAIKGANKKETLTFEDFLERYHEVLVDTIQLYTSLVVGLIDKDPNQFAKSLQQSTNKSNKNRKKFNRRN